jgi:sec-independent protein translocase protein TatC
MLKRPSRRARRHNPEGRMSVLDHLRELRYRLIIVILIIGAGAILGWALYNPILEILKDPYCNVDWHHRLGATGPGRDQCVLVFSKPLDGFIIRLKVAFVTGALITAPLWLYQIWAFVTPGLRKHERRWTIAFVASSTLLFLAGMGLAYLTLAKALQVLISQAGSGVSALLDVNQYITFVMLVLVIFGASFELPLLVVMLNAVGVLPYRLLKRSHRLAIFLIFVFAAVATPSTDPFTMIGMAVPMCLLYELAVWWSYYHDKRKARRRAAVEAIEPRDDVASEINPIPESLSPQPSRVDSEWTELP